MCEPERPPFPVLLSRQLADRLDPYRRFRNVAVHTYAIGFDRARMEGGVRDLPSVFAEIERRLQEYLSQLGGLEH
jgi:uncharacterized protein YutE (UPF0331/DUF86 family)